MDRVLDLRDLDRSDPRRDLIDAAAKGIDDQYREWAEPPSAILLTRDQWARLVGKFGSDEFLSIYGVGPREIDRLHRIFGIPVEVLGAPFPYLIGGPAHGRPLPVLQGARRQFRVACGGSMDGTGWGEVTYRRQRYDYAGDPTPFEFWTCLDPSEAMDLFWRELLRIAAKAEPPETR